MRVAEVWEGFREARFAPPEPETTGAFREDCLRASTNLTFYAIPFEPEFRSGLSFRVTQGTPRFCGATTLGSPSFSYFSWRSKKSDLPPGNPRHRSRNKCCLKSTMPPSQPCSREGRSHFARSRLLFTPAKYRKENKQRQQNPANQKENLPPRFW